MSEGWIPLSWVSLLSFLVFLILGLGVVMIFQSNQHHGLVLPLQSWLSQKIYAGWHSDKALSHERSITTSAPSPCVFRATQLAKPRLETHLGKFMLTLGSTSGNAEGQLWFLALWSFSSWAKLQHTSQASTLVCRCPGHSRNWLSKNRMGFNAQTTGLSFLVFRLEKSGPMSI